MRLTVIMIASACASGFASSAHADAVYGRLGLKANEKASFAVVGYSASLNQGFVNSNGHSVVQIGSEFQSIGTTVNGADIIEAKWSEAALATGNFIDVIFRTRHGRDMVPLGTQVNGQTAAFWGWNVGKTDAIEFQSWVTDFRLIRATWSFSLNGGNSFIPGGNHTARQPSPWNGFDPGDLLDGQYIGAGVNAISVRYHFELIPAPSAVALLGLAGLVTGRRRR
ncbi:MAG: hypothetical protein KF912_01645 [Phycisphaeraceae bacterium]|nr:hypothetical protein [Phycisphaeraceae bacterium]QYK48504.1 MAG: hypothetical protein KF838_01300 [Phycisphaeraceae bacterium]